LSEILTSASSPPPEKERSVRVYLPATAVIFVGMVAGALLQWVPEDPSPWRWLPLGVAYLAGGGPIFRDAWRSLRKGRFSIDLLMGVAAIGAAAVGEPLEGAILLFLFSLSNTLEGYAMGRTRNAIAALMELHPEEATLVDSDGREIGKVSTADLQLETRFLVRPGERIAADGRVVQGRSDVDQSPITGESAPVPRTVGDEIFAGTMNGGGSLIAEVSRPANDTMLARIVRMVEEAREERAPAQEFIDRFAHPYTIIVLLGSAAVTLLGGTVFGLSWGDAFYRAMTLLVVGSPCALVISTPAAVLSAIANGARHGVLIKGGAVLDRVGQLNAIAFDKTGTLTLGTPRLLSLQAVGTSTESDLLTAASGVEALSEHHLARAVLDSVAERGISVPPVNDFLAIPGEGVQGRIARIPTNPVQDVEGPLTWVGNEVMAARYGARIPQDLSEWIATERSKGRSTVIVGASEETMGAMSFGDQLRPGAAETIRRLKEIHGVRRVTILSGDHPGAVEAIARELGADEVRAGLLPDQKVEALRAMANESLQVAMVGDGVNDAPAMAAASVGVAMGAVGTDVAIETADVVLMGDEIPKVEYLLALGRRARRVVRQNVFFSVGWMGILVVVASTVGLPLTFAVVAHEGSTLLVVLNGLRLLRKL